MKQRQPCPICNGEGYVVIKDNLEGLSLKVDLSARQVALWVMLPVLTLVAGALFGFLWAW